MQTQSYLSLVSRLGVPVHRNAVQLGVGHFYVCIVLFLSVNEIMSISKGYPSMDISRAFQRRLNLTMYAVL